MDSNETVIALDLQSNAFERSSLNLRDLEERKCGPQNLKHFNIIREMNHSHLPICATEIFLMARS